MRFHDCPVQGAYVVSPSPHEDERGRFMRAWCARAFAEQGIRFQPVQANMAYSEKAGTLRGLHYQVAPALEAKLVRCTRGAVFDVVADLRPDSPTYLGWHGVEIGPGNGVMLFVPEGCAHGCVSLEDRSEIHYLTSAFYAPEHARGVRWDDPAVGIRWPRDIRIASDRDREWPRIRPTGGD